MKVKKQGWINISAVPKIGLTSYGVFMSEEEAKDCIKVQFGDNVATIQIEWEEEE